MVRRPVGALMILVLVAVLGVVAYDRIPIQLMPDGIVEPWMSVIVPFPDSSPEEVLEKITKPVEDAVRSLKGVRRVTSNSAADESRVGVSFVPNTDMDEAYNQLQDQLERVQATFPDGAGRVRIFRRNFDVEMPIVWFGILCEDSVEDPYGLIEDVIQPRMEAVDGVAQVDVWGMVEESLRVFVRPDALRFYGLSLYEVVTALRRDNFTLPAGVVRDAGREFLLRIDTTYRTLAEVQDYPIAGNVRLRDVAQVEVVRSYRDYVNRVNGKNALTGTVSKESGGNTVEICERALAALKDLEQDPRLAGVSFNVYFSQADLITGALGNLKDSMGWGALFAVLVLYLFVRRVSTTLLVALAIPVSLMSALVVVYFTGFTFNIISLAGFTLAIGMLVDNSVVVAENIDRHRAEGLPRLQAAAAGAAQVALAIVASTLTTIVVFTPLVFMAADRNMRVFLGELAAPITWSLLASLLTALFLLPIATVHLARKGREGVQAAARGYREGLLARGYRRTLAWTLDHRFGAVIATLLVLWLGALASGRLKYNFGGDEEGDNRLRVEVELPKRFTLEEASDVFERIEDFLLARREPWQIEDVSVDFRREGGRVSMWFEDGVTQERRKELSNALREELPRLPGVAYKVGFQAEEGSGAVRVQLHGRDTALLGHIGDDLVERLDRIDALTNVRLDVEDAMDELRVNIDRDRAQRFGVSQEVLQGLILWGVGGQFLPDYRGGAREIPMLVEYEDPPQGDLNYLKSLDVPVIGGGSVPLAALTTFDFQPSLGEIRRIDGVTSLNLLAESLDDNSYRVHRHVMEVLENYPFPEGYGFTDDSARERFEEDMGEVFFGLLVGALFVYLLMGMLFESAVLPLSVLLGVPLAMVGAYGALFVTGTPMDGTASLALILLAGVVVNNGIVLVDRVTQLRRDGHARREAIVTGCAQRVRPVLMTALTTIFGLLPMAMPELFASEHDSVLNYKSLAIATLGGMVVSTALTLLVVPLFYSLFDDLGVLLRRVLLWAWRPSARGAAGEIPT